MEVCTHFHRLCKATHMPLAREGYLDRYMKAIYFLRQGVARNRLEIPRVRHGTGRLSNAEVSEEIQRNRRRYRGVDGRRLLMEMLHGSGAKDDEEAHPEGGALKGN